MDAFRQLGYSGAERVGRSGIELWGEDILRGRSGATLYVAAADKTPEDVLAQAESEPSSSLTLTMDASLQAQALAAMDGLPGAVVVIEVDTGRVLALVSSPAADTNWYDPKNYNFSNLGSVLSIPNIELNRASQGQYPLGSVFQIVTMAAALESGLFAPDTVYDCPYFYTEIPGVTLEDWTWQRCEDEKLQTGRDTCSGASSQPSGELTLVEGLMRSCDPWFYHIGYTLYNAGQTTAIADMSRGFGLAELTGIGQVEEEPGRIPLPTDGLNATSLAIGQGDMLVTPLQVVNFIAAIANGGTLTARSWWNKYSPRSVTRSRSSTGGTQHPADQGGNPGSHPGGNAHGDQESHAAPPMPAWATLPSHRRQDWHSGKRNGGPAGLVCRLQPGRQSGQARYRRGGARGKPGEGSVWALPIFRRVMEIYFFGSPQTLYPWETNFGVINPEYGSLSPPHPLQNHEYMPSASMEPGLIVRSQSGFFTVQTGSGNLTCSLRGRLKQGPRTGDLAVVGDRVQVNRQPDGSGTIESIEERRTALVRLDPRPQGIYQQVLLANPDQAVFVFACAHPEPHLRMLDRFLVIAEKQGIPAVIVANKVDLVGMEQAQKLFGIYPPIGYPVIYTSAREGLGTHALREQLEGRISALAGPSGVGKSSLLNGIQPGSGTGGQGDQRIHWEGTAYHHGARAFPPGWGRLRGGYARHALPGAVGYRAGGAGRLLPRDCPPGDRLPVQQLQPQVGTGLRRAGSRPGRQGECRSGMTPTCVCGQGEE